MRFEDICKVDDYCRLARNICQKLYKNRTNGKIDYITARDIIRLIRKKAVDYFNANLSALDFLILVADAEKLRCQLIDADITTNNQYQQILNLIKYERESY